MLILKNIFILSLILSSFVCKKLLADEPEEKSQKKDSELEIGLYLMTSNPLYVSTKRRFLPIPFVSGSSSQFYAQGTEAGYVFNPRSQIKFKVYLSADAQTLNPNDSPSLNGIRERGFLGFAGVKASLSFLPFQSSLSLEQEILFRAKGQRAQLKISGSLPFLRKDFDIEPSALLVWTSQKVNHYYYGVSESEASSSIFEQYKPSSSLTPYLGLWIMTNNLKPWGLGVNYLLGFLSKTVQESPLVNKTTSGSFLFYASYTFK